MGKGWSPKKANCNVITRRKEMDTGQNKTTYIHWAQAMRVGISVLGVLGQVA